MLDWVSFIDPFVLKVHAGAILMGLVFLGIITSPVYTYIWVGWPWKRNDIFVMLDKKAKDKYLITFQRQDSNIIDADTRFEKFYDKWYGRKLYIIPIIILSILAFYLGSLVGETALYYLCAERGDFTAGYTKLPLTAAAAVTGAFTFTTWDLTSRAARRDMSWNDVFLDALRLAVCIPVGYAMAEFLTPALSAFVAFFIAVVPVDVLANLTRRILNKKFQLDLGADSDHDQLAKLSGIDPTIADRIYETDITTISQLAYCDPIQLAMRSNLSFAYLLDGISQALSWLYLEDKLALIRPSGMRGAFEMHTLREEIIDKVPDRSAFADEMAAKLDMSRIQFDYLLTQVGCDPYTEFLVAVFS